MKVLVVEDDRLLINLYQLRFNQEGFDASFAVDGVEALAMLKKDTPDVILLDFVMPKMDGFSFLGTMQQEKLPLIPVIAVTNLSGKDDIQKAERLGVKEYIVKGNTNLDAIVKKVKEYDPAKGGK